MLESRYQKQLIERLESLFPGCMILKNDANGRQGIPDLLILHMNRWAMLEVKASASSPFRPNQEYYLELLNGMSFAAAIWPSNEEEILSALQVEFSVRG